MFSRIYKSAKALFTELPGDQKTTNPAAVEKSPEKMVTTRRKDAQAAAEEEFDEEDSIVVYVPSSTQQRQKRALSEDADAEFTSASSKKRKRLPVRSKEVQSPDPTKTRPVVEIPAKKMSPAPEHIKTFSIEHEGAGSEENDDEGAVEVGTETDVVEKKVPEPSKHQRFGSEPIEDEFFSTAREVANEDENEVEVIEDSEEDIGDSEDDAPEAVGIQEAAKNIMLKEIEAAKAVKDQLSASRKKRKDKDDALKKQAESSKKRKLEADITSTSKPRESSTEKDTLLPKEALDIGETESHYVKEGGSIKHKSSRMILSSKGALPDMLPAEYLEDTEPQELVSSHEVPRKAKKTKFPQVVEKEPKDRRKGMTTYRVTKASSKNLAPKSSTQARNIKESWLQGRSGKTVGTNRTSFSKGFFKK